MLQVLIFSLSRVNKHKTAFYWTLVANSTHMCAGRWHCCHSSTHSHLLIPHTPPDSTVTPVTCLGGSLACLVDGCSSEHDRYCLAAWRFVIDITPAAIESRDIFIAVTKRNRVQASRFTWTLLWALGNYLLFERMSIKCRNIFNAYAQTCEKTLLASWFLFVQVGRLGSQWTDCH